MTQPFDPDRGGPLERPARDLSAARILVLAALVLLPVVLLALLWIGQVAAFLLFAGILVAAILDAATRGLTGHTPLSRPWSLGIVIGLIVVAVAGTAWFAGTYLAGQAGDLYGTLQDQARRVGDAIDRLRPGAEAEDGPETPMAVVRDLGRMWWGDGGGPALFVQSVLGALANVFIIFFVGVFLALDPGLYKRGVVRLFPEPQRADVGDALGRAGATLRHWLAGKLLSMGLIAGLTYAGLLLIGYPLALPLSLLAGLLAFVPNLGPLLAYIPIALTGLSAGMNTLLLGVVVYAAAQTVESYIFTPLIQKRMVSLPPALILISQVFGGLVFGLWGIALATPLVAVLKLWIERYYVERALENGGGDEASARAAT